MCTYYIIYVKSSDNTELIQSAPRCPRPTLDYLDTNCDNRLKAKRNPGFGQPLWLSQGTVRLE